MRVALSVGMLIQSPTMWLLGAAVPGRWGPRGEQVQGGGTITAVIAVNGAQEAQQHSSSPRGLQAHRTTHENSIVRLRSSIASDLVCTFASMLHKDQNTHTKKDVRVSPFRLWFPQNTLALFQCYLYTEDIIIS